MQGAIIVYGDIMLDIYLHSAKTNKIESDKLVCLVNQRKSYLGGAANVAANLAGCGCDVRLIGSMGNDAYTREIHQLLDEKKINREGVVCSDNRINTVKTRVRIENEPILRYDMERYQVLDDCENEYVEQYIDKVFSRPVACVVISDYQKGMLDSKAFSVLKELAKKNNVPIMIDSKSADCSVFEDSFLVSLTADELGSLLQRSFVDEQEELEFSRDFMRTYNVKNLVLKKNKKGVVLISKDEKRQYASTVNTVVNTVGAGDAFVAACAYNLAAGRDVQQCVFYSNQVSSFVVQKADTYAIQKKDLVGIMN